MSVVDRYLYPRVDKTQIGNLILWPISIMLVLHRTVILAVNGARTDDFTPVYNAALAFLNQRPVYNENYETVDPHYLYPPSGSLLMSPIAILDPQTSRWVFIGVSAAIVVLSAYLLARLFGYDHRSWVFPALIVAFFSTEAVTNTLVFTNFNAVVLLGLIVFMMLMLRRHDLWAGVAIGLVLSVKPILAPILLLPLLSRQWKVLITAIGVPVVLNALAWPLSNDPMDFVKRTVPYLGESRDYYNSSISGNGAYFGLDGWLVIVLRIAFVLMAVFGLWFCYRYFRKTDELLWLATSSGILLGTFFLVGSLGQGYYSMLLFPLLMTVVRAGSAVRNWPAWLGAYGCLSNDLFYSSEWEPFGRYLQYGKVTWGWSLLMIAVFCSLLFRYLDMRRDDVLGIDSVDGRATTPAA